MRAVLKFGGSVFEGEIINKLVEKLLQWSKKHELAVVVGGGKLSREYGALGRRYTQDEDLLDTIGIFSARLNASILISALGDAACPEIPRGEKEFMELAGKYQGKIIVSGGFRPKQRTDAVAVEIAQAWKAEIVVKGTDVDYAYDKDPKQFEDAKPIEDISFEELEKMVSVGEYQANAPTIMDRTAAGLLKENKIKVAIVNGKNLDNIEAVLEGKEFKGTKVGF
jgi:uridylate kinase